MVEGEFVKLRGITIDITKAKEAEERFFKAFHNSPTAMAIARKSDQRFIEVNDQFIALTGYGREELIGQTAQDLLLWLHSTDQAEIEEQLRRHGEVFGLERKLRRKDGSVRDILASITIIDISGQPCFSTF